MKGLGKHNGDRCEQRSTLPHITIKTRDRAEKGAHYPSRLAPPPAVLDPVDVAVGLFLEVAPRLRFRCNTPLLLGLGEPAVPLHSPARGWQRAQANLGLHHAVELCRSNLFVAFDLRSQIVPGLGRGGVDVDREDSAARGQQRKGRGKRSR